MAFVIPTIYSAVDKMSPAVRGMISTVDSFASKTEAAVNRSERAFRKLTPSLADYSKKLLSTAKDAALFAGVAFSAKSIMDYETELANLQAVTGASGKSFDTFKSKIKDVANQTKTSSVDVAKAFTAIANNQPELLKDANALAAVTKSSIILAQASKMELGPAGEALTQILNQFGKGATDAAKTIDILAAGSVAGSSEIRDTADAIQKFGVVAANAGIKINESVALIELGSKFQKGTEAGEKFKNILLTMSAIKVQDPKALADLKRWHVSLKTVSDSTIPLAVRLKEISKIGKDNGAIFHVFGKENQAMATGILNSAGAFQTMLDSVNTEGMAIKMAEKNNETFARSIGQLRDKFITWITTSDEAAKGLKTLTSVARFLADHFSTIVKIVGFIIGAFILWKAWIYATKIALFAMKAISTAVFIVDMIKYVASTQGITFAQAAWAIVTQSCTDAMLVLNAAMLANPVGLIIAGIIALIALVVVITNKWNEWGAALSIFLGPLGLIISLVQSFRRNWDMITKSFAEGGILSGLKAIGKTLLDAILMPLQQLMSLIAKFTGWDWASSAAKSINKFRADMGVNVTTDESGKPLEKEVIDNRATQHQAMIEKYEQTNNAKVGLTIDNKSGNPIYANNPNGVKIAISSTMLYNGQ